MEDSIEGAASEIKTNCVKFEKEVELKDEVEDDTVLKFLDSTDDYLTLIDSLSSKLRQGWLELASARHSMGASRLNSVLLSLKVHDAATSLQLTDDHADSGEQPHFILRKWGSCDNAKEDELLKKSSSPQLRHRGNPEISEEETHTKQESSFKVDDQVQKERSRTLSMFGTLVPPKLRAAQLSFETALETLVEIANRRSEMLSSFDEVRKGLNGPKR